MGLQGRRGLARRHASFRPVNGTVAVLVGPVAGLLGVGLGYLGTKRLSDQQRQRERGAELSRALAAYLGALYPVVAELRAMPHVPAGDGTSRLDRLMWGEAGAYVKSRQRLLRSFGTRHFELQDRFAAAAAQLKVLPLPMELEQAVDAATAWVEELAVSRAPDVTRRWPQIWEDLHDAARAIEAGDR
jgi:hypothetical protein